MILELVLALSLNQGREEHPGSDRWFAPDKAKHFFLSAFIQSASFSAFRTVRVSRGSSLAGASVVSAVFGVGKEISDRRHGGTMSVRDLMWDAAGAGAVSPLLHRTGP